MTIWNRSVGSELQFAQTAGSNFKPASASNTLVFTEKPRQTPAHLSANQKLNFVELVTPHLGVRHVSVSQSLQFLSQGGKVWQLSVTQAIHPFQTTQLNALTPSEVLTFVQTATGMTVKSGANFLTLVQVASAVGDFHKTGSNTLILNQGAGVYKEDPGFIAIPITPPPPPSVGDGRCD